MKRWKGTAAALALGMTMGVGMAFGFGSKAEAAPVQDAAGACAYECRSNADCTRVCGGFEGFCRFVNSCQSYCLCSG